MIVRIAVVYGLSTLAGVLASLALVKAAVAVGGKSPQTGARSFGMKALLVLALIVLVAVPVILSTGFGHYVWIIDEGNQFRRYLLYGMQGTTETTAGKPLTISIGPGRVVETVVNGTTGRVIVESVQYGGAVVIGPGFRKTLESGASLDLQYPLNDVKDPPSKLEVTNGMGVRLFAYQAK